MQALNNYFLVFVGGGIGACLRHACNLSLPIEQDGAGAGRALVQGQDEFMSRHGAPSPC